VHPHLLQKCSNPKLKPSNVYLLHLLSFFPDHLRFKTHTAKKKNKICFFLPNPKEKKKLANSDHDEKQEKKERKNVAKQHKICFEFEISTPGILTLVTERVSKQK